ncbi:flagellar hook protein FlgE [Primorskyibacter flagellatus]|uniref:Flagellar hook protein FlgE n=2 Tax=Primorskyibacter flagellatus TaxID=1387277 RepID=A0A917AH64_9RHOB|nr:flagellar hook protein FlgE [Primorskyibacter flagellatus]
MANSKAVSRISYNIANSDTYGFRRSFAQMLTAGSTIPTAGAQASGVRAEVTHQNTKDGTQLATTSATNLAISGNGFFAVTRGVNSGDGEPQHFLTRAGDFQPDSMGYLRNAAGLYLAGFPYDETGSLGVIDRNQFSGLETVRIAEMSIAGNPTTAMTLSGNLPSQETGVATPGDPFVSSIEYFTALGAAERLQFSWQPTSTANEWTLNVTDAEGATYGSLTATFNDSGPMAGSINSYSGVTSTATAPAAFAFDTTTGQATITINNGTTPQTITVDMGAPGSFSGLNQFAGDYIPLVGNADGTQSGSLARAEISANGTVYGIFDNGMRRALYQIPLATVPNPNGLLTADNSIFLVGEDSGAFTLAQAGTGVAGEITGGAIESSNVDIAEELTELIQKQRAFSSNAKIITTADEMLDETVRLKR